MASLPPQSGIARELETETDRDRDTKLKFAFFCRHFRFCFFCFCFCFFFVLFMILYYILYSLLLAWPFYYYIFVAFYAVWQCLNDSHIRSVCQSPCCLPSASSSFIRALLIRPGYCTCFPEFAVAESPKWTELIQLQIQILAGVQWSLCYTVHSLSFPFMA